MTLLNKILQFKIYRRIIVSYSLMFILAISFLSCILFYLFASSTAREINSNSREMLLNTSYASDVVYDQVTAISNQLYNNNDIRYFINSHEENKAENYNISLLLSRTQSVYPFITSIGVYNFQNGSSVDTMAIPIEKELLDRNFNKYIVHFPREVTVKNFKASMPYRLLTFILFPDFSLLSSQKSAIIINIDQSYILKTIGSISGNNDTSTLVIDLKGSVISHKDTSFFMKDLSNEEYVKRIIKENASQGSFIIDINKEKNLVTYVKSDQLSWYFVSIKKYDSLIGDIYKLRNITLLITLLLIIFGIIITINMAGAIYNPIRSLIEKVGQSNNKDPHIRKFDEYIFLSEAFSKSKETADYMESTMKKSSHLVRESHIVNLLKGNLSNVEEYNELCKVLGNKLAGPYFCIILFKIDNYKEGIRQEDQSLFRFAAGNIAQEQLSNYFCCESATPAEDEVVVILQLTERKLPDELYLVVAEIQDAVRNYFKFTVSVCLGNVTDYLDGLADSYKVLLDNIRYRLFFGYQCILDPQKVNTQASKSILYPSSLEKKIIEALQLSNIKLVQKHIGEYYRLLYEMNYFQAVNYSNQMILSVLKQFSSFVEIQDYDYKDYTDAVNRINSAETAEKISEVILEFCSRLMMMMDDKNSAINTQKHKRLIDDVKAYVIKDYSNPNLSIEFISDHVNLSPGYLGKLFKSITGTSFNDYVNNERLEQAKKLLAMTSEPASEICIKVGIFNVTYFSTLFKKTYGITPSQFRSKVASGE